MKVKKAYLIQTILLIIYIAVTPLLVSQNPLIFHDIKLKVIYASISLLFLVSMFFYNDFRKEHTLTFRTFKTERFLIIIALFMMIISFLINLSSMNAASIKESLGSILWQGAGPNYLSFLFYSLSLLFIATAVVIVKHTDNKLITKIVVGSLILVGCIIVYQIFVNDFLGRGQNYLYGWGNSNYTPDPFSIVGLMLLIPFLFKGKVNYLYLGVGIFFFEIVLLSASRAAFLALFLSFIISAVILYIKKKTDLKRILIMFGFAILIIFASYTLFAKLGFENITQDFDSLGTVLQDNVTDRDLIESRVDLWAVSLSLFANSPITVIFGTGQSVYMWNSETTHYIVSNTHNQYIDILLSSGIIVFFIFIILLYRQFIYAIKLVKYDINNIVLLSSLIFICIKWMFNSLNAIHSPFIFIVFVLISYRYMKMESNKKVVAN